MDLETVGRAATALGKLVGLGMAAWKAVESPLGAEDLKLVHDVVETAVSLAPKKGAPRPPARHAALVASAFGEAWRQHWALAARPKPGELALQWQDYFFSAAPQRNLLADAAKRLQNVLSRPPGDEALLAAEQLESARALSADPLTTPYYRALLHAFTQPDDAGAAPLLPLKAGERVEFERRFLRAYHEGLAAPGGAEIRDYLLALVHDRAQLVRQLLVADLTGWGERHVFGNVVRHEALPPMPLEKLYVEPLATAQWQVGSKKQTAGPRLVLGLLDQLMAKHPLMLVVADFGLGKSLTARKRAADLARAYLESGEPSPDVPLPIFIRCAEDFASADVDLDKVIRRALQRQAREIGLELPLSDPALAPPGPEQRAVFFLDGLDEVALSERQVAQLLRELRDRAGARHRFVVLSRPAAVPPSAHGPDVPRVRIREFTDKGRDKQPGGQVGEWLERWNALRPGEKPLTVHELGRAKVLDLATTPILLFMIAFTWTPEREAEKVSGLELFERFFQQIARGKHEADLSAHPQVAAASERLRDALVARELLASDSSAVDAMLWLLGRVAWEAMRREEHGERLSGFHVERIVREEVGLAESADAARSIRTSLLLVLQADFDTDEVRILFGHAAFKEFLVARHWAGVLLRMARSSSHRWRQLEPELYGARLLQGGSKVHEFLHKLLFRWTDADRHKLAEWAAWSFNEERPPEAFPAFSDDPRAYVREMALFLGSMLPDVPGITARTPLTLRALLAWLWLHGKESAVWASRLHSPGARLESADLRRAKLDHAELSGARFDGAQLENADFFRANLSGAHLDGVRAQGANFDEAILQNAFLRDALVARASLVNARLVGATMPQLKGGEADFTRADMLGATLNGANLDKAKLQGATLVGARMHHARLKGADLSAADLSETVLHAADLSGANLSKASLRGAVLHDAKLRKADLRGADLRRANLSGADLEGADLNGADLREAVLDGARRMDLTGAIR